MNEWLDAATERIAAAVQGSPADYALSEADAEAILELARIAAHASEDRRNAPLVSYLVGLAHGRASEASLAELARSAGESGT